MSDCVYKVVECRAERAAVCSFEDPAEVGPGSEPEGPSATLHDDYREKVLQASWNCRIGVAVRVGLVGEVDPVDRLFLIGVPSDPVAEAQHPARVVDRDGLGGRFRIGQSFHRRIPRFEVIEEGLFELGSEISEDHLDLGPLGLVEHP